MVKLWAATIHQLSSSLSMVDLYILCKLDDGSKDLLPPNVIRLLYFDKTTAIIWFCCSQSL